MKTILTLFLLALCFTCLGQTVTLNVPLGAPFLNSINPTTNRAVKVQVLNVPTVSSASVIIQDIGVLYSDPVTGILTVNNAHVDQIFRFTVLAPPSQTVFEVYIPAGSTGTVNATNTLVANSTATFPAGSVAWSAATSDARYAAFGSAGSSNFITTTNYGTMFDEAGHRLAFQTGVLVPDANNAYDLGAPGQEFGALYANSAVIPGRLNSSSTPGGFAYFTGVFATSPTAGNLAVIGTDSGITNGVAGTGLTYNNTTRTLATNGNGLGTSATFNQMPLTNVVNANLAAGLVYNAYNSAGFSQIIGTNICTLVNGATYLYTPPDGVVEAFLVGASTESYSQIIQGGGANNDQPVTFVAGGTKGIFVNELLTNGQTIPDLLTPVGASLNGIWTGDGSGLYFISDAALSANVQFLNSRLAESAIGGTEHTITSSNTANGSTLSLYRDGTNGFADINFFISPDGNHSTANLNMAVGVGASAAAFPYRQPYFEAVGGVDSWYFVSSGLIFGGFDSVSSNNTSGDFVWYNRSVTSYVNRTTANELFRVSQTSGGALFQYASASTVPYLDSNKKLVSSSVTPTTLGYLDATSSIQTQLNGKATLGSAANFGNVTATVVDPIESTVTLTSTGVTTDWSTAGQFAGTLATNVTFTFSGQTNGMMRTYALANTSGNFTVTWPTTKWQGGVTPVQTIGAHIDIWTFVYSRGTNYGSVVQNY